MFHFFWKVIYFLKNYIILHYVLDFKYRAQGLSLLIMPIIIMQWRVEIGMSNPTHNTRFINEKLLRVVGLSSAFRLGIRYRWEL